LKDAADPASVDLSGRWRLTDGKDHDTVIDLPGDVISGLHAAGLIPEPYHGRNEYRLRWIAEREWTVRREVVLADTARVLHLSGLDCVATVRINGVVVLEAANAFRTWRVDVSHALQAGGERGRGHLPSEPRCGERGDRPRSPTSCPGTPGTAQSRTATCSASRNATSAGTGTSRSRPSVSTATCASIPPGRPAVAEWRVSQVHGGGVTVEVTIRVRTEGSRAGEPVQVTDVRRHCHGRGRRRMGHRAPPIESPRLWWPAGLGEQALNDLIVAFGDHAGDPPHRPARHPPRHRTRRRRHRRSASA
jgi:beta-mannosidase